MVMTVNKTELAKVFGVSTNTVGKWMGEGCPNKKEGHGVEFDTVEVIVWMYGDKPSLTVRNSKGAETEEPEDYLDPEQQRARKDKEGADKLEIENRVSRGELVEASDIDAVWADIAHAIKNKLLGQGSTLAPVLEGLSKKEIKTAIDTSMRQILEELASNGDS